MAVGTSAPRWGTTVTTASERRARRSGGVVLGWGGLLPLLPFFAIAAISWTLVYLAVTREAGAIRAGLAAGRIVDLNTVDDTEAIARALEPAIAVPRERATTARRVLERLPSGAAGVDRLPNVGALAEVLGAETLQLVKPALVVRGPAQFRRAFALHALLLLASVAAAHLVMRWRLPAADPLLLPIAACLAAIGFAIMASLRDPYRDIPLAVTFARGVAMGSAAFAACAWFDPSRSVLRRLAFVPLLGALGLSAALVLFGTGPEGSDAKVNLLGAQPIEVVRVLIVLFLAGYFAARWESLRELHERTLRGSAWTGWLRVPPLHHLLPLAIGVATAMLFFFLQRDLGPALILCCVFLALYAVSRRHVALAAAGLGVILAAFAAGHWLGFPRTVSVRTSMWLSPWENGLARGDQLAHSLWAFASGGRSGTGLGLGSPEIVPAAHTDLVLSAVGEELGLVGVLAVLGLEVLLVARGLRAARRAPDAYGHFLALGLSLTLAVQAALIVGGVLGLVPLSGVVTPFLSYGRSAMIMNLVSLGLLAAVSARGTGTPQTASAFGAPLRVVTGLLAGIAVVIAADVLWMQGIRADRTMGTSVLVRQADGVWRFVDNPRLREVAASIRRGTLADRNGVPLATDVATDLLPHRATYEHLGIRIEDSVDPDRQRHYPLAGLAFHVLGDEARRLNWGATNTAYLEKELDATLRGYDDHERPVLHVGRDGTRQRVLRRDLRELVPLWRYRHRPGHGAVRAILERPRDVRTSLDARLQVRLARVLQSALAARGLEHGAAVVLDPRSGEVLAAVSHPWPDLSPDAELPAGEERRRDVLLDRVRFGRYPPGSTFKLAVAAAALRQDAALAGRTFRCTPLGGGRVGAVVAGRPVRDDPHDRAPHGIVAMERGTVLSCNAYYAQLGLHVGWDAVAAAAQRVGATLAAEGGAEDRRALLREGSYGQGRSLASPLSMARLAAAYAAGGIVPEPRFTRASAGEAEDDGRGQALLPPSAARTISGYMRAVVTRGTGRALAGLPIPVAGKTGTAEVARAPSHSWFAGYAPHGRAGRKVAFAVLVENGGYGGGVAASVAGQLVRECEALGLID